MSTRDDVINANAATITSRKAALRTLSASVGAFADTLRRTPAADLEAVHRDLLADWDAIAAQLVALAPETVEAPTPTPEPRKRR